MTAREGFAAALGAIRCRAAFHHKPKDVARSSPSALLVVRAALARALYRGTPKRELRDMNAWLETLLDLAIEAGEAIEDPKTHDGLRGYLVGLRPVAAVRLRMSAIIGAITFFEGPLMNTHSA